MTRLDEKIADYKALAAARTGEGPNPPLPQKRRAEMESEIWALVPTADRKVNGVSNGRGHWLCRVLGGYSGDYEHRCQLLSWGAAVDVLWERLEADLTLSTAIQILRSAKKAPGEMAEAVRMSLGEYDARPHAQRQADGKIVRKKAVTRLPDLGQKGTRKKDQERARMGVETIWMRLRAELGGYVAGRLADLDPRIGEEIYRDFERDLNMLVSEYQHKIDRTRSAASGGNKVSRRLVIDACAVLVLDPPSPGRPVDLAAARKQRGKLAKVYHPDAHGGDESMRAQYERVIQAYERLDQYNSALGRKVQNGAAVVAAADEGSEKEENDHGGRDESGAV